MLDLHTGEHGYTEINPPLLVSDAAMFGTGAIAENSRTIVFGLCSTGGAILFWLIPTAEVPLTNLSREHPRRNRDAAAFHRLTPCFRAEAGAAGKDTRGMIRQHQFTKVELVSITTPEESRRRA